MKLLLLPLPQNAPELSEHLSLLMMTQCVVIPVLYLPTQKIRENESIFIPITTFSKVMVTEKQTNERACKISV